MIVGVEFSESFASTTAARRRSLDIKMATPNSAGISKVHPVNCETPSIGPAIRGLPTCD